jgi:HK97 gp10 family phage protein
MARETVRLEGLNGVLAVLKQYPVEMSKAGGPVKLALRDAANLLRDQARDNLRAIIDAPNIEGVDQKSTGLLLENVVASRGRMRSQKGERYLVRVRKKPYKVEKGAKPVSTPQVARLLEYGTEKRRPMPWLRPAFDSKKNAAVQLFVEQVKKRSAAIVKRLERQARRG